MQRDARTSYRILTMRLDAVRADDVATQVTAWAHARESRYVCCADVNMVMQAHDREAVREAVNQADIVTPDGVPLVWWLRHRGVSGQERVCGPDLLFRLCADAAGSAIGVGFFGSGTQTLADLRRNLQAKYPELQIAFTFSPPYREPTESEDEEYTERINASGVSLLFVGLGCPKQELWMSAHRGRINAVMVGVGAAFDIAAGNQKLPPAWVQKAGLQWIYRVCKEPSRLWKRYLFNVPRFLLLALGESLIWRSKAS